MKVVTWNVVRRGVVLIVNIRRVEINLVRCIDQTSRCDMSYEAWLRSTEPPTMSLWLGRFQLA